MKPTPMPGNLAGLLEMYLTDALARGRSAGTVSYRRVYLRQFLSWLKSRGVTGPREVTAPVLPRGLA